MNNSLDYSQVEGLNYSLLKHVKKGPRHLKAKIDQYSQPRTDFKTYFDFGNAFEDALLNPQNWQFDYGFVAKQPDASGKYATYGRIIADAIILKQLENLANGLDQNVFEESWLEQVKRNAHLLSTLAGDVEKADKELDKEPYKSFFNSYIQYKGKVTDAPTWAKLQELVNLSLKNDNFQYILTLPRTDQEVLTWKVTASGQERICKGKSDTIAIDHKNKVIYLFDIKSTGDNLYDGSFHKSVASYGYDEQLFGYMLGIEQHPEYSKLLSDGYRISMFWAVGTKEAVPSFSIVPFQPSPEKRMELMFRLARNISTYFLYEEFGFAEQTMVEAIV